MTRTRRLLGLFGAGVVAPGLLAGVVSSRMVGGDTIPPAEPADAVRIEVPRATVPDPLMVDFATIAGSDPWLLDTVRPATAAEPVVVNSPSDKLEILYYGDSLLVEAAPYLGVDPGDVKAFAGTALCDWSDGIIRDVAARQPDLVVLVFSGNAHTGCMDGVTWDQDEALARRYASHLGALRAAVPVPVMWARTPLKRDCCNGLQILVHDIDAGAAVENPDGTYAQSLGGEQVRHRDGVHFCPIADKIVLECPVESPGARRFAAALRALRAAP